MTKKSQNTKFKTRQETPLLSRLRDALRFAGHALGCEEGAYCRCGFDDLCKALAKAQREAEPPPADSFEMFRECAAEITGHHGEECLGKRCRCGAKKALRKLNIRSPDTDQFVSYWCSRCSREHHEEDLQLFWREKEALNVPFDSTIEELKESNRKKCEMGNCPTENCSGPVRRSVFSIRRTIPDVPF